MKCVHCGSEWNVGTGLSASITNCPFCGKSLLPEKKPETIEAVLVEINNRFGVNILTDETKLLAYFSDMAPQLAKKRRILQYFIECGGPKKIIASLQASQSDQLVCIRQIVRDMKEEMYIEESASQMICDAFLFAVSGKRVNKEVFSEQKESDAAPVVVHQKGDSKPSAEEEFQKGEAYYNGTPTVSKDYQEAFQCYYTAAMLGHAMAQCQLGLMYRDGLGIEKDEAMAFQWFLKAAAAGQNCPRGKFYVGRCYQFGNGVKIDYAEAVKWYTVSAKEGDAYAQLNLGVCNEFGYGVKISYETAVYWYELSANQGDSLAQYNLGLMYKYGRGVKKDKEKAVALFKKSAAQGDPNGICLLGTCYAYGEGVETDKKKAFTLIKRAAEMDLALAQYKLGYSYENGEFCGKNQNQAFAWYTKAAQNGNINAQRCLAQCYKSGYGTEKSEKEAFFWYQKAADGGDKTAMAALGECYEKGIGTVKEEAKAVDWYLAAIKSKNPQGVTMLLAYYSRKKSMTEDDCKNLKDALTNVGMTAELSKKGFTVAKEMVRYTSTRESGINIMTKCAEIGNVYAQFWLGNAYNEGTFFEKNEAQAIKWYEKAMEQGHQKAAQELRKLRKIDISKDRVAFLVKKYRLENKYMTSDSIPFLRKVQKAITAYAPAARREIPVLMEDQTIFGSAKEGFLLTEKALYYYGGIFTGKYICPI